MEITKAIPSVDEVAVAFSKQLRSILTADQMAEVVRLNMAEGNSIDVCHSHDFCDANEVMLGVFESFGITDTHGKEMEALWNQAWQSAKLSGFAA